MADLIDRKALMEAERSSFYSIYKLIREAPTVDAVEVVRCKDCKHYGGVTFGNICRRWSVPLEGMKNCTKPDDFCSYGEVEVEV